MKTISIINDYRLPQTGETGTISNGLYIIDPVVQGVPADNAGIKWGDTISHLSSYFGDSIN